MHAPIRLEYRIGAGTAQSRFLRGIAEGKLLGQQCPVCSKVYMPPRGSCPIRGVPTDEEVELPDRGTVTTFCVVNIPFSDLAPEVPYVCAQVLLDGADTALFGLIAGMPANEVRMGLRVRRGVGGARRVDVQPRQHQVVRADRRARRRLRRLQGPHMRDVAVVGFAQSRHVASERDRNEVEILMPVVAEALEQSGLDRDDIGFTCSGSCDYLPGCRSRS